jgi:hypothetical protein
MWNVDSDGPEMRPYYDFSEGRRGRYAERYAQGTNIVRLDPDVASRFPNSESVNAALREYIRTRLSEREEPVE